MKQKLLAFMKHTVEFIKEGLEYIAAVIALSFTAIAFWFMVGLAYVGSAKIVGEWLKLVLQYMN